MNKRSYKERDNSNYEAMLADSTIRYCTGCRMCWEIVKEVSNSYGNKSANKYVKFYNHIPSWGKQKLKCFHCLKMKVEKFVKLYYTRKLIK